MRWFEILLVSALLLAYGKVDAQASLTTQDAGIIRSWGDEQMASLLHAWQQAFRVAHPEISFSEQLYGSATGMAGIITGTSDLALMGRPITVNEVIGFEWVFRYKPLQIQILNGALNVKPRVGNSQSLVVLVSVANPVTSVTMQQLASILTCRDACAEPSAVPTWSLSGAPAPWARRPIHAYVPDNQTGTGVFLQQAIASGQDRWNWAMVHETDDPAAALRKDPNGLAITTIANAGAGVKILSIDGVPPTPANVTAGTYPLARGIYIDINRKPGAAPEPRVAAFLRFILSPEGQAIAASEGTFLPLNPTAAAQQAAKLQ